jgi:hypothetical protein
LNAIVEFTTVTVFVADDDEQAPFVPPHQLKMPPPRFELLFEIVELSTVSAPALEVTGLGPKFWIPPESAPPLLARFPDTSEWVTVNVPPSFDSPPPDWAVPPVTQSSLNVRVPSFSTLPPNDPLLAVAAPILIVSPDMVTVGTDAALGGWTKNTRSAALSCTVAVRAPAPWTETLRLTNKALLTL